MVFDIIYMSSQPLKMVFHDNKLILIDPQYLQNEEYLTNPPIELKSTQLDENIPLDILSQFKN